MTKYNEELLQAANIVDNLREFAEEGGISYSGLRSALSRWRKRNNINVAKGRRSSSGKKKPATLKEERSAASGATVKYSDPNQPTMDDDDEEEEYEDDDEEEEYEDDDEEDDEEEDDYGVTWDEMKPADRRTLVHSYFEIPDFQRPDGTVILQEVADELDISVNSVRGYYFQYRRKLKQEGRLDPPSPTPAPAPAPPTPEPPPPQYQDNGNGQQNPAPAGITPEMWHQDKQQQREWERTKYYDSERRKDERAADKRRQEADVRTREDMKAMNDRMFAILENRGGGDGGILGSETLKGALEDRLIDVVLTGGNGQEKSDAVQIFEMINKSGLDKEIVGAIRDYRRDDPGFDPYDEEEEEDEDEEIEVPPETYRKGLVEFLEPAVKDKKAKRALRQQIDVTVENVLEEFGETKNASQLTSIMGSRMNLIRKVRDIGLQLKKVAEGKKTVDALAEEFWDHSPEFAEQLGMLEYQQIVDLVEQYKHTGGVARDYEYLVRDEIRAIGEDAIEKIRNFTPDKDL